MALDYLRCPTDRNAAMACSELLLSLAGTVDTLRENDVLTGEDVLLLWCLLPGLELSQTEIAERLQRSEAWVSKRIGYVRRTLCLHGFPEMLAEPNQHVIEM